MTSQAFESGSEGARPDASQSVDEIRSASRDAGQTIRQAASTLGGQALDKTEQQADAVKGTASDSLRRVADQVRHAADGFEGETGWAKQPLERGAEGLESAAAYLSNARVKDIVGDVQRFAQRNPAAFLATSVLAGFVLARVGKTAAQRTREAASSSTAMDEGQGYSSGFAAQGASGFGAGASAGAGYEATFVPDPGVPAETSTFRGGDDVVSGAEDDTAQGFSDTNTRQPPAPGGF